MKALSDVKGVNWVPIATASAMLGITRQAVRKLIDSGSLAGKQLNNTWLVSVASITARLEKVGQRRLDFGSRG